jgi:hypothetical protein
VRRTSAAVTDIDAMIEMINYPIELRPGVVAQIRVPASLTHAEAEKIIRVVRALGEVQARESGR